MKIISSTILMGVLVLGCSTLEAHWEPGEDAKAVQASLMSARTMKSLTDVLRKAETLSMDSQDNVLALCLDRIGGSQSAKKLPWDEHGPKGRYDLSVAGGRCAWLASKLLKVELPAVDAETSTQGLADVRMAIIDALAERRKKAAEQQVAGAPLQERLKWAGDTSTPAEVLAALAQDTEVTVRREVAANAMTPSPALRNLANSDPDADVRQIAANNLVRTPPLRLSIPK